MDNSSLLIDIAFILLSARLFAETAARLNMPPVIGELVAGIVLGPSLLGWVEPNEIIRLLAEVGIILLLFEVGLETDLGRLINAGKKALTVALSGFLTPFLLGFALCYYVLDLELVVALFIGGTLTATSIGITVRILADLNRQNSREGQIVLGAAVVDDVLGVILLAVLYEFSVNGVTDIGRVMTVVFYVAVFFFLAPPMAKLFSLAIKRFHDISDSPGTIPVTIVSLVLIFAGLAHLVGAPELLGGFAAGIALSRRFFLPFGAALKVDPQFNQHIHQQMRPIIQLFTPIFFVMVGLSLDISAVDWTSLGFWLMSLTIFAVAILGKMVGGFLIAEPIYHRIAIGMAMVPRGEVGLVFAELGRVGGILSNEVYTVLIIVIAYTTLLAPFWIKSFYRIYGKRMVELEQRMEDR